MLKLKARLQNCSEIDKYELSEAYQAEKITMLEYFLTVVFYRVSVHSPKTTTYLAPAHVSIVWDSSTTTK